MTQLDLMRVGLSGEQPETEVLEYCLYLAKNAILQRRYPHGFDPNMELPSQFNMIQVEAAIATYNKMGAEGQVSHSENGVQRSYGSDYVPSRLLATIVPTIKVYGK